MPKMSDEERRARFPSLAAREARLQGDLDALIEMLSSDDPKAQVASAGQLRKLRDPRAVPALVASIQAPKTVGKTASLKALRDIGDRRAADAVFNLTQDASEPFEVRATAAQTLLSFGDRRGVKTVAVLFSETNYTHHGRFRKWALPFLVEAKGTEALPYLRAARPEVGVLERRRLDRAIRDLERLSA